MHSLLRTALITSLSVLFFISCKKDNSGYNDPTKVLLPDTLSAGWEKLTSLPAENFTDIFFYDNNNGFTVSSNGIYKSDDAGATWTKVNNVANMIHIGGGNSSKVSFVDGNYVALVSPDGGANFQTSAYPYPGGGNIGFFDCFFADGNICYYSSNQYVWKSIDAGITIDTIYRFPTISNTSNLFFLNDQEGWLLRQDGLYHTTDAGDSWNNDTTLVNGYGSVKFLDNLNGYFSLYGSVNKTTDGGINWTSVFDSPFMIYTDIEFITVDEGYAATGNRIYKTTDGGANWTIVAALGNEFVSKLHFTDAAHGWACTSDGALIKFTQ